MVEKFIDLSASNNGTGNSTSSPYNSLAELNSLTGNQNGDFWLIKAGTSVRGNLQVITASNLNIGQYFGVNDNSASRPKIVGSKLVTVTWTADQDAWYIPATDEFMLVLPFIKSNPKRSTALATIAAWEQYYDSINNRLYLKTDGTNPNTLPIEINDNTSPQTTFFLNGGDGINVTGIHVFGGSQTGMLSRVNAGGTIQDHRYYDCVSEYIGWRNQTGGRGNQIAIAANTTLNTGHAIIGCHTRYSDWNAFEISYLNGFEADGNTVDGINGNVYELWNTVENSTFERTQVSNASKLAWLSNESTAFAHNNNVFKNCIAQKMNGNIIKIQAGTGNKIYNNSGHIITNNAVVCDATAGTIDMQNNVFIQSDYIDQATVWCKQGLVGSTVNNNIWYRTDNVAATMYTTGINLGITGWNTEASGTDKNADPGITNYETDMTINSTLSLAAFENTAGTTGLVTSDFNNLNRAGGIDIGALQLKRDTTVSVSSDAEL